MISVRILCQCQLPNGIFFNALFIVMFWGISEFCFLENLAILCILLLLMNFYTQPFCGVGWHSIPRIKQVVVFKVFKMFKTKCIMYMLVEFQSSGFFDKKKVHLQISFFYHRFSWSRYFLSQNTNISILIHKTVLFFEDFIWKDIQ